METIKTTAVVTIILVFPLYLWRSLYPGSDWAVVFLFVLAMTLFYAGYTRSVTLFRARLKSAIRTTSPLSRRLTGRLRAVLVAGLFAVFAAPILAWQALTAGPEEITCLIALILVASLLAQFLRNWSHRHLHPPYAGIVGVTLGAAIAALIFFPLLAWVNWNFVSHPGAFRTADLSQAVAVAIAELPQRRGWIAEILAPLYAFEAAKLWLVLRMEPSGWAPILFSLDSALVGFIVARASALLTCFAKPSDGELRP